MALDNNQYDGHGDIAQFLEKFKEQTFAAASSADKGYSPREGSVPAKPAQYERSFEKLEKKIVELEERFEASATQNQLILSELARTREAMERQKDKDAFLEHLSRTIANLKASVENLSRAQQERFAYREPDVQRSFDPVPPAFQAGDESHTAIYHYQANAPHTGRTHAEREEKERIITSLRQKASQLKAVNSALDREIKKAQQEKMEALKKSAEQAKEILSLRDQLTAAEERFKSFDFEGRIISIKQEYQQKVSSLENQLQAMSDTCMKQVEEIESLKAENVKLHKAAAEKEEALARLEAKEKELVALKNEMAQLADNNSKRAQKQLAVFSERLRALEGQRDGLAAELEQAQASLDAVRQEKDLLEKNFKELVEKINNNDAVIEQLKHKIEVLGQQNEELTHHNETLSEHNAALQSANETLSREKAEMTAHTEHLAREKESLSARAQQLEQESAQMAERSEHLTREKEQLASRVEFLAREKDTLDIRTRQLDSEKENLSKNVETLHLEKEALEREKSALSLQSTRLQKRTEELEGEKKELAKENQQLRNQSAALLAARLVQEKERAAKEETLRKAAAARPAAPKPSVANAQPAAPQAPVQTAAPAAPALEKTPQTAVPLSEKPVEMNQAVKSKVMTEADLPEIKVADPVPQPEPLFDGEDFLEKTDSFIGRMKWSIFREDK
ncbi:hypothetical protein [Candidatus Avelusimicrobium gallicola]|uniref:Uncharacterized protein n=1 Tax=Candidatus Avelusimicrobium gallicola TaxID=2562704 RepID=A0A1Y4DDB0_9BACT|nr:hypothetical protein [Elusimicrobium sp. An273]OUO56622.1 hypothetical protein B5F75_05370 [Elusimicrobium sp. An273]